MTTGKIVPMLIAFAIPIMGGNLFQQLYTVVDTMIVGRFLGVSALAAVGAGGWMTWLLLFDMALVYLRIYYYGAPVMMAYNYAACHLRALGNSKDPVVAVVIASITNIVLDILFVGPMGMGVAGAVIATVIAQIFAAIYYIWDCRWRLKT